VRIYLRAAKIEDCRRLWFWRNDAEVRSNSFSGKPIQYAEHKVWFESKLNEPETVFLIGEYLDKPFGMVRLDIYKKNKAALLHISIRKAYRGRGLGSSLLAASCRKAKALGLRKIQAEILTKNKASLNIFKKNNFHISKKITNKQRKAVLVSRLLTI